MEDSVWIKKRLDILEADEEEIVGYLTQYVPRSTANGAFKWIRSRLYYSLASALDNEEIGARLIIADQRIKDVNDLLRAGMKPKAREEEV